FFQAEDGIRDRNVTGVQTCALPIWWKRLRNPRLREASAAARVVRAPGRNASVLGAALRLGERRGRGIRDRGAAGRGGHGAGRAAPAPDQDDHQGGGARPRAPSLASEETASFLGEVAMPEQLIGTVVHYFKGPSVAVVRVTEGTLAVGDRIRFHGHTTEFTEQITSMEVNHQKVPQAKAGDEVAIQVTDRTRQHDQVFKVTP